MDNRAIGLKIAKLRQEQELSTTELARRAGLSQPQVSRLENGRQGFRSATLERLAAALGVKAAYFFAEETELVEEIKGRVRGRRRELGQELADEIRAQHGELAVTPGYRRLIRRLAAALAHGQESARTLRRLIDRILAMNEAERERLLNRLNRR